MVVAGEVAMVVGSSAAEAASWSSQVKDIRPSSTMSDGDDLWLLLGFIISSSSSSKLLLLVTGEVACVEEVNMKLGLAPFLVCIFYG